jgi:ABC-2 type transport system ATP-binding protein
MITFSEVTKQFSKVRAVDELSFTVKEGEIFALLGPNGAGKTTSVRMLMQVVMPDSGTISYDDALMDNGKVSRSRLGYLPEERGLYQDTPILKTLVYLATLRGMKQVHAREEALRWLKRFELTDRQGDKVSALSKGNQQKVQFIASILHKPAFAILDEPFSGFDPINQEVISDMIRELRDNGTTILLSAHQMQLVERIADRILLLSAGRELMSGTLGEIRSQMVGEQKLEVQFSSLDSDAALTGSDLVDATFNVDRQVWQVMLKQGTSVNDALTLLTRVGTITQLKTAEVNLHDIFISSFSAAAADSDLADGNAADSNAADSREAGGNAVDGNLTGIRNEA